MPVESVATLGDAIFATVFCVPAAIVGLLVWRYDRRRHLLPFMPELAGIWGIAMLIGAVSVWTLYFLS